MGTITEKRKSVTLTAKMNKDNRADKPTTKAEAVLEDYKPTANEAKYSGPWNDSIQESWNKRTGDYTMTKEWVYT